MTGLHWAQPFAERRKVDNMIHLAHNGKWRTTLILLHKAGGGSTKMVKTACSVEGWMVALQIADNTTLRTGRGVQKALQKLVKIDGLTGI